MSSTPPERGFSFRFDTELDMRMNKLIGRGAKEVKEIKAAVLKESCLKYFDIRRAPKCMEGLTTYLFSKREGRNRYDGQP